MGKIRILFITSQWPSEEKPHNAPFVKREAEALQKLGIQVDLLIYTGGWSFRKYFQAIRSMHRMINTHRYDLIHARFGQCGLVARFQKKLPVVVMYGGSDIQGSPNFTGINRYKNYLLVGISRLLARMVDEVIVVAEPMGRYLPRSDFHVIPSGLDLELFQPHSQSLAREKLGLSPNKKIVLFVGDPAKKIKRFSLAQAACTLARGQIPELELVVVNGEPSTSIPWYLSAGDVLLLVSSNEGSPNVVKEALACNLPIVSVDVGDVRERLSDIDGCLITEDDSPHSIADAIVTVLSNPKRLNSRTNEKLTSLDISKQAEKIMAVHLQAIKRKHKRERH